MAKRLLSLVAAITLILIMNGCAKKEDSNKVVIYSSSLDYELEYMSKRLNEEFPNYKITIEYLPTGNHAAKLLSEGKDTECDITYALEYGYLNKLNNNNVLANLSEYDFTKFEENAVASENYQPILKNSGAVFVNSDIINEKNLNIPHSYEELLKPEYKGLISMPNPKSSGTGYMFYKALVNSMGEEKALEYFDKLSENILQFTSSGSGPVNSLIQGEAAIGLGMTPNIVKAKNDNDNLQILSSFGEFPYSLCGQAIINGKDNKKAVKDVFAFLSNTFIYENCEKFYPEKIFKDKDYTVENYPTHIKYADMSNDSIEEKGRLLSLWKY